MQTQKFKDWLDLKEMSERPQPGGDWGYSHSGTYQDRPTKNQWIKKGQRAVPAFTDDDELFDPHRPHSEYEKAAYKLNVPKNQPPTHAPQQTPAQVKAQEPQAVTPEANNLEGMLKAGMWVWAKSTATTANMPAAHLDLAIKQHDENNFMFVILDVEEGRLVKRDVIPKEEVKQVIQSQRKKDGTYVAGSKPSDVLAAITPDKGEENHLIPDHHITDEQEAIEAKFVNMMQGKAQNHMMINALAGSGKTTVLKHLAHKYSKGQNWLYLVFNAKNKAEAQGEFPEKVQVETTNGWAGREVLGMKENSRKIKQTDRIINYTHKDKSKMVADTPAFQQVLKSLNITDHIGKWGADETGNKPPTYLKNPEKGMWWLFHSMNKEFKNEAVKILGLVKSFAIDPRKKEELDAGIQGVMDKYDINSDLERTKEKLEKNSEWLIPHIDREMGGSFLDRDFSEELKKACTWLMHQTMPHASEDKFTATKDEYKDQEHSLGQMRDFDDDLWYSAIHAEELSWPKYDVVLADEVQDFNAAQKIMLKKLTENGAKIVAVGDPNQAIYRFRGADNGAFAGISEMLTDASEDKDVEQPLTRNFRSRQAIVDMTNKEGEDTGHVSNLIKGRPFSEEPGRIGVGQATKYEQSYDDSFSTLQQEMSDMGEVKQTAYLARTNEPLVHASLQLMKQGTPFIILGKDLAKDLNKHMDRISGLFFLGKTRNKPEGGTVKELLDAMTGHDKEQQEKHSGKVAMNAKMKELKETTEALAAAIEQFVAEKGGDGLIMGFRRWLAAKFGGLDLEGSSRKADADRAKFKKEVKENNPVILSTVHKSKGLQFQRVYILRDDQWPHPKSTSEDDLAQEANNRYIGRTRAEDELHILELEGQPGYKEE